MAAYPRGWAAVPLSDGRMIHGNPSSQYAEHHKDLQRREGQRQCGLRPAQGLHPRAPGGERRRQDHADEHPLRALPAGGGHHFHQRPGGGHLLAGKGHPSGDRHGAPALHAGKAPHGDRKCHAGQEVPPGNPAGHQGDCGGAVRAVGPLQNGDRPQCQDLAVVRGRAAAGGDPDRHLYGRGDFDPGRAHRRPDASGDGGVL